MFLKVCLGQLFMKARERHTASSAWRVDTGQRAGKASLLVLRCDMPPSQRVKRYEVAVGSMPPAPRERITAKFESCLHTRVIILEEPCLLLPTSYYSLLP